MQVSDLTTDISLILLRTPHDLASSILGWSPDGVYRAAAMEEERVHVWDDASGETVAILEGRGGKVRGIAWSPDSVYLAVVKESQLTYIWEAANGKMVAVLKGRGSEVHEIAWSPDGAYLAVAEEGQLAHIWEAASGETLPVFDSHSNEVSDMKWSAGGDYLATVDIKFDMNSQLNPEVPGDTVQIRAARYFSPPCEWLQSNLTVAEWRRYRGEWIPYRRVCRNLPAPELPPVGAALKTFVATRGRVNYLFLTYQGWAVVIGSTLLALATMSGAGVLVVRLGKHTLQRAKSEKQVSGLKRGLNVLNR
jgi:dipeptidyl aminopeptidase/acylaminoacyl peptidase